jgi:lysine 2,3-aminomutase
MSAADNSSPARPGHRTPLAHAAEDQPFHYPLRREYVEPDRRRLPGYRDVTEEQWRSAQWQRAHSVKNLKEFKAALGDLLPDDLLEDIRRDQEERATMSMLIPPQMINTMDVEDLRNDRVRRYMAPAFRDRETEWASHPMASRDSLHEADMWAVEGLTHRYPTKVLAELIPTCPQYCGHCTRMDLVGNDTLQVLKYKFEVKQNERWDQMLDYLRRTPQVRDVVVSGGDMANVPIKRLETFVMSLLDIENIRDIRLATKGLMGIPQHFLQDDVKAGFARMGARANERGVDIALHTHVNCAQQVTPLVGAAARMVLDSGFRDVRNQGVLLRGVNTAPNDLLELCFMLLDHAKIMPYYFYMCDMIPNAEHWRTSVAEAQDLQYQLLGYMPGFATPRVICDVPFVGKRWVHMVESYDRERGISTWTKNYRTGIEFDDPEALSREYVYFDPIYTLPEEGQQWWREQVAKGLPDVHWIEPPAPIEPAADALGSTDEGEPATV